MRLMRAAVPPMAERGWGRVVNVASTAGKRPSQQIGEYSVAKAAQLSLSRLFADRHAGSLAEVDVIASTIAFLCSERASYVLGSAWSVDGGTVQVII